MRIARGRAGAPSEQRSATFTGRVWADPVLAAEDGVTVNAVFFEPGARTHWHSHDVGQVLHVTHGEGWVQVRGGDGTMITAGDVVHIGPGEEHWHGAAPTSYVLHVAVSLGGHEWLEPVSDEDYAQVFGTA
jgi:quercetin dioxygenase-like cupin family protein